MFTLEKARGTRRGHKCESKQLEGEKKKHNVKIETRGNSRGYEG